MISHLRAYHGNTIASAGLSGMHYNHASLGLPLDGFLHVTPPHHYRYSKEMRMRICLRAGLLMS